MLDFKYENDLMGTWIIIVSINTSNTQQVNKSNNATAEFVQYP